MVRLPAEAELGLLGLAGELQVDAPFEAEPHVEDGASTDRLDFEPFRRSARKTEGFLGFSVHAEVEREREGGGVLCRRALGSTSCRPM
jgi:hypothetical protein